MPNDGCVCKKCALEFNFEIVQKEIFKHFEILKGWDKTQFAKKLNRFEVVILV